LKTVVRILTALVFVLALALFGRATSTPASTTTTCGGSLCATVTDVDGVSPSFKSTTPGQPDILAYQLYQVTIANNGSVPTSAGTLSVILTDVTGSGSVASTAEWVTGSFPGCARQSQTPANKVNCSIPSIPAGGSRTVNVVYRTSRTPGVTGTNAAMSLTLGSASLSFSELTSLENDPEDSDAWSPPNQTTQLGTSPNFDNQFSSLQYKVPAASPGFAAGIEESNGVVCAPSITCFGELVTTDLSDAAAGTFSPANLFRLTLTYTNVLPNIPTNKIVVSHRLDNGSFEVIRRGCHPFPPTASSELPCIQVDKDEVAGRLVVTVYGFKNGGWMIGG
jgi:hypothetical protein